MDSVAVAAFICGVSAQMPQDYNINRQELDVLFRVFDETGEGCQILPTRPASVSLARNVSLLSSATSFSVLPLSIVRLCYVQGVLDYQEFFNLIAPWQETGIHV